MRIRFLAAIAACIVACGDVLNAPPDVTSASTDGGGEGAAPPDAAASDAATPLDAAGLPTPAGLVADWPFVEGTGTAVKDVSGHGHDGTATGGAWGPDRAGTTGSAYVFDGESRIEVAGHPDFDRPADAKLTIAGWARPDEPPSHAYVLEVGYGEDGFGLELEDDKTVTYWDGAEHIAESTVGGMVGAWHHYAVVLEGAEVRVYFDGARVGQAKPDTTPRTAAKVYFGYDVSEPVGLAGAVDKMRFYRAALTDAEIVGEMNR